MTEEKQPVKKKWPCWVMFSIIAVNTTTWLTMHLQDYTGEHLAAFILGCSSTILFGVSVIMFKCKYLRVLLAFLASVPLVLLWALLSLACYHLEFLYFTKYEMKYKYPRREFDSQAWIADTLYVDGEWGPRLSMSHDLIESGRLDTLQIQHARRMLGEPAYIDTTSMKIEYRWSIHNFRYLVIEVCDEDSCNYYHYLQTQR